MIFSCSKGEMKIINKRREENSLFAADLIHASQQRRRLLMFKPTLRLFLNWLNWLKKMSWEKCCYHPSFKKISCFTGFISLSRRWDASSSLPSRGLLLLVPGVVVWSIRSTNRRAWEGGGAFLFISIAQVCMVYPTLSKMVSFSVKIDKPVSILPTRFWFWRRWHHQCSCRMKKITSSSEKAISWSNEMEWSA